MISQISTKMLAQTLMVFHCRRRVEGHPSRSDTNRTEAEGLFFYYPRLLPGSDAASDVVKPELSFVIQNRQTSCSMWCLIYEVRY